MQVSAGRHRTPAPPQHSHGEIRLLCLAFGGHHLHRRSRVGNEDRRGLPPEPTVRVTARRGSRQIPRLERKPGAGKLPVTRHGRLGGTETLRNLGDFATAKEPGLDYRGLTRIAQRHAIAPLASLPRGAPQPYCPQHSRSRQHQYADGCRTEQRHDRHRDRDDAEPSPRPRNDTPKERQQAENTGEHDQQDTRAEGLPARQVFDRRGRAQGRTGCGDRGRLRTAHAHRP